ncbi:PilT protein-like [Planktothrix agardhii]|jgi:toxin FitB|uniref:type II toxin-antitoxin system VapC family toxin n=2 Tax=Planktothrix agardhii TaxID=1160 RepID=UPI0003F6D901|nr:type II toxin-antitoxin system VapC family toxin [Planktothrix agardhii]CAD0229622.1 PilT protein-like [Planktothrix agardhii]CAD5964667.1 PilT protein-like [Planktothrix rubescens]CAH2574933.1 PilT protein-like [Planktothrix rubescens]
MLLDSNIIIYAAQIENIFLRDFIAENSPYVSAISYLEVLGYHQLMDEDKTYFQEFFTASQILPISQSVINQAVKLKQLRKMSLGDAIIAGTALVYDLTVVTRNIDDFCWITDLKLLNPFDDSANK